MRQQDPPPLLALFQVTFDQKIGYTLTWQKTSSDVDLTGVEFKSLPSGLHEVDSDVVYYSHQGYVGITVFQKTASSAEDRNAVFTGVGILAETIRSGPGNIHMHIVALQDLARTSNQQTANEKFLEAYWSQYQSGIVDKTIHNEKSPKTGLPTLENELVSVLDANRSHNDPASALPELLRLFGPLLFPLHRKALLRRRILLLGNAPVQQTCNFVYATHLLTHVSSNSQASFQLKNKLPLSDLLFSIGIADIDDLSRKPAFIACTTDSIMADKTTLYDLIVKMPQNGQRWPSLFDATGQRVRATQHDVERYRLLLNHIKTVATSGETVTSEDGEALDDENEDAPLLNRSASLSADDEPNKEIIPTDLLEARSWSGMAHQMLSRWTHSDMEEAEIASDTEALQSLSAQHKSLNPLDHDIRVIASFFAHLNAQILDGLDGIVATDVADPDDSEAVLEISPSLVQRAGLDAYSESDRSFIEEAVWVFGGRLGRVVDDEVRLCGLRIC